MIRRSWEKKLTWLWVCLLVCGTATYATAAASGAPGAYLKWGVDARASALGGAYTAVGEDAAVAYWNPAGLSHVRRLEFRGTYTAIPESGTYSQLAFAIPSGIFEFPEDELSGTVGPNRWGTISFSLIRLAAGYEFEAREVDSLNPNYLFSDVEGCYSLAWGMPLSSEWSVGLGLKGLYHQLDQAQANGWGLDAGLLWQPSRWKEVRIGLGVRDVYSGLTWKTGRSEVFPVTTKAGVAYTLSLGSAQQVLASVEGEKNSLSDPWKVHAGGEYGWHDLLFIRAGVQDTWLTCGGGVRIPTIGWARTSLRLDYAAVQDKIAGWDHWITLGVCF